jgi:hypothetical protein
VIAHDHGRRDRLGRVEPGSRGRDACPQPAVGVALRVAACSLSLGLATAELSFERDADHVVADLCLVGTASEMAGTFLWAWANDAIPAGAKLGLDAVRSFGTTHDLPLLTTPEWPGG